MRVSCKKDRKKHIDSHAKTVVQFFHDKFVIKRLYFTNKERKT